MRIAIAGRYSAPSEDERNKNFEAMNMAAARLLEQGHIPVVGVNAALPVVERACVDDQYEAIMRISLAVIDACDAILVISESAGVLRERDLVAAGGKPVFYSMDEIPPADEH